jgi:hypothetical protein
MHAEAEFSVFAEISPLTPVLNIVHRSIPGMLKQVLHQRCTVKMHRALNRHLSDGFSVDSIYPVAVRMKFIIFIASFIIMISKRQTAMLNARPQY